MGQGGGVGGGVWVGLGKWGVCDGGYRAWGVGEQGAGCGGGGEVVGGSSCDAGPYHSAANTSHEGFCRLQIALGSI
jgi:hypothetical protein